MTDAESDAAHLSSVSSQLEDLTSRVTEVADRYSGARQEGVAEDLYATERALIAARRALARALDALR